MIDDGSHPESLGKRSEKGWELIDKCLSHHLSTWPLWSHGVRTIRPLPSVPRHFVWINCPHLRQSLPPAAKPGWKLWSCGPRLKAAPEQPVFFSIWQISLVPMVTLSLSACGWLGLWPGSDFTLQRSQSSLQQIISSFQSEESCLGTHIYPQGGGLLQVVGAVFVPVIRDKIIWLVVFKIFLFSPGVIFWTASLPLLVKLVHAVKQQVVVKMKQARSRQKMLLTL